MSGTLTFFYSESDDLRLARAVENRLGQGIGLKSNGLSYGNYHILRENTLPATLVELGFLSNSYDEAIVRTSAYQKKAAKAIADGLADYFKN
ncbi:N-acetylmuramoyl-L-alanine amidase LytC precursor [compost metagenome]